MAKSNRTANRSNASLKIPRPSGSKANAAGYAKRHSRKAKSLDGLQASDIYEYQPEKVRRSKVTLELDRDEAGEFAFGGEGEDVEEKDRLKARLVGENGEDEKIESGDDEEIDSDGAFEESDEETFAGFFSIKGKKKTARRKSESVRFVDVDLNEDEEMDEGEDAGSDEDEEMEEEGNDDEFIDVLDVLDGKGEVDNGSDSGAVMKGRTDDSGTTEWDNEGGSGGEDHDEEEGEDDDDDDEEGDSDADDQRAVSPSDSEDAPPEALDHLQNFISTLDPSSKKRKAPAGDDTLPDDEGARTRKRRMIKERTEAGVENEFRAQTAGSKLNLDDLLAPLSSQSTTLLSLKKSTKVLAPSSKSKTQTLSAPLPQRTQERLDREAAYEQTKEEVDKWTGTMKRIREAEHLSFPLQAQPTGQVSNVELAAKFKPTTALESSVDALLKSAQMREEDIQHTEDNMLQQSNLSVEEVAQRRGELRKMRELMFRAEIKARRVGKIKSKTYRRIKRREKERFEEKLDDRDGSDEDKEGRMKREVERARERATLRHKNTGKWAKQMRGKEGLGLDGRREIEEMLERGERLTRKIRGAESDEGESEDSDEDEVEEGGIERIKNGAFEELEKLNAEAGQVGLDEGRKGKGIFDMKFMKDAMAREQQGADRMVDDFIKEMGGRVGGDENSDTEETDQVDQSSGVVAERTGGRLTYRPGTTAPQQLSARPLGSLASDTSSVTLKSTDPLSPPPSPQQHQRSVVPVPTENDSNPWLTPRDQDPATKAPRKKNEVIIGKDSTNIEKSKNKLKKRTKKRDEEKEKARDDAVVEISMENVLTLGTSTSSSTQEQKGQQRRNGEGGDSQTNHDVDHDSDANSEVEAQEKALDLKGKGKPKGLRAFEQRDLVALAFAGDNVVQDFEEAKRREIAADAPREIDTTLPGWGAWGGTGTRRAPPKPHLVKKVAGVDPSSRADFKKSHVIISEKRDKKAAKYLVKDLPYPYTSKAQFERSMDRPLGTEWNTRVGFQRGTLPKVVKKMGTIIDPLEKLL